MKRRSTIIMGNVIRQSARRRRSCAPVLSVMGSLGWRAGSQGRGLPRVVRHHRDEPSSPHGRSPARRRASAGNIEIVKTPTDEIMPALETLAGDEL